MWELEDSHGVIAETITAAFALRRSSYGIKSNARRTHQVEIGR